MAAHKYWKASVMAAPTPGTVELSEFHLYDGATRVDASATLTASAAPTGALSNLKDDNTGTGCYWSTDGNRVELYWVFPTPQNVDGIVVGSRTTTARYPTSVLLQGGDTATGSGPSPEYTEFQPYAIGRFTSATKTGVLSPTQDFLKETKRTRDLLLCSGVGRVPFEVVEENLPRTDPRTYTPKRAKVFLQRFIDGRVMRVGWSDPVTGLGAFDVVDENLLYTLTAIYPETGMRAVIADRIKPEGYPEP